MIKLLLLAGMASAGTVGSFMHNRDGLKHLGEKQYFPAYQDFMRALADEPLSYPVQMNLGLVFMNNEEFAKAEQAFRGASQLAAKNPDARFDALFNLALAQTQQSKLDEALASYQECLELKPDSLEVKTNIELLWQSGGGGKGKGKNKDQKDKDDKQSNQEKREKGDIQNPPQKKQPKDFQSQDLSKEDVKRILDEIKNQEQGIRAQEYDKSAKEAPRGKDW